MYSSESCKLIINTHFPLILTLKGDQGPPGPIGPKGESGIKVS